MDLTDEVSFPQLQPLAERFLQFAVMKAVNFVSYKDFLRKVQISYVRFLPQDPVVIGFYNQELKYHNGTRNFVQRNLWTHTNSSEPLCLLWWQNLEFDRFFKVFLSESKIFTGRMSQKDSAKPVRQPRGYRSDLRLSPLKGKGRSYESLGGKKVVFTINFLEVLHIKEFQER